MSAEVVEGASAEATEVVAAEAAPATSTPRVIDLDALLAPIAGENPAGESLKYGGVYDEIREARRADDELNQGDWKRETKAADWSRVIDLSTDALATKSKDLQLCAWLAEALVKVHGFDGLRDSLALCRGLHELFWEGLYPEAEEGDLEGRANAVSWMDRQTALAAKDVRLTNSPGAINLSFNGWEVSKTFTIPEDVESLSSDEAAKVEELRARAVEEGKYTSLDWKTAKSASRRAFYESLSTLLNECWSEFQLLDHAMDEKFGRETPGLSALKKVLEEIRTVVAATLKEKRLLEPDPSDALADGEDGAAGDGSSGGATRVGGALASRQAAMRQLAEVVEYFRRNEPHSPIPYLIQRAINWGNMPLELWLRDVVKNDDVLGYVRETLGLNTPTNSGGGEVSPIEEK
jgi:type VI secretion system protein ImpA